MVLRQSSAMTNTQRLVSQIYPGRRRYSPSIVANSAPSLRGAMTENFAIRGDLKNEVKSNWPQWQNVIALHSPRQSAELDCSSVLRRKMWIISRCVRSRRYLWSSSMTKIAKLRYYSRFFMESKRIPKRSRLYGGGGSPTKLFSPDKFPANRE